MYIERDMKRQGTITLKTMSDAVRKLTGYNEEQIKPEFMARAVHFYYFIMANAGWADADRKMPKQDNDSLYMPLDVSENILVYQIASKVSKEMGNEEKVKEYDKLAAEGLQKYQHLKHCFD